MSLSTPPDDETLAGLVHAMADALIACDADDETRRGTDERTPRAELAELRAAAEREGPDG